MVTKFKLFSADELINQLETGVQHTSNPFTVKEPSKDLEAGALALVISHFEVTGVNLDVSEDKGYTLLTVKK